MGGVESQQNPGTAEPTETGFVGRNGRFGAPRSHVLLALDQVQNVRRIAPALPDFDMELELNAGVDDLLDLQAGFDADRFDGLAAAADDDLTMVVALDENRGFDVGQRPA